MTKCPNAHWAFCLYAKIVPKCPNFNMPVFSDIHFSPNAHWAFLFTYQSIFYNTMGRSNFKVYMLGQFSYLKMKIASFRRGLYRTL